MHTRNPKPAAKTIETAIIRRPDAIPPSLNAIWFINLINNKSFLLLTISDNYLNHPNLLLMVNKSKKIEVNERIKPNSINGLDLRFSTFLGLILEEEKFLSFFL